MYTFPSSLIKQKFFLKPCYLATGPVSSIQSEATPTIGIKVTWLPPHSHCNVTIYKIRYSLTFYDQCETRTPSWTNVTWTQNGTDDSPSLTIETVETFSTYQILIIPVTHGVIEGQVTNISVISHEDGKAFPFCVPLVVDKQNETRYPTSSTFD